MFLITSSDTSLTEAIANTCMGIGTVFLMLIFISLIISLFGFIPKLEAKLAVKKSSASAPAAPAVVSKPVAKASENLMNDAELVAVITAAVYAASGSAGTSSKDKLVVRSIRRAR